MLDCSVHCAMCNVLKMLSDIVEVKGHWNQIHCNLHNVSANVDDDNENDNTHKKKLYAQMDITYDIAWCIASNEYTKIITHFIKIWLNVSR